MSKIPTSVTQKHFEIYIDPLLSKAKRGYVSKVPLFKIFNYILYWLHTGCQWYRLPIDPDYENPGQKECSYHAVYYHYRKWSKDGSLKKVWEASIQIMKQELELSHINLDGTHIIAKKGGEEVAYQGRKKSKTSNILPVLDGKGYVIGTIPVISGNHNDSFNLKIHLQDVFRDMKSLGLSINGSYFNADKAFDTKDSREVCFNHGLIPNIPENQRNRKKTNEVERDFLIKMYTKNVLLLSVALHGLTNLSVY